MKEKMKRIVAAVLTLCMSMSLLPPSVFAVEQGLQTEPVQVVYDFDLAGNYPDDFTSTDKMSVEKLSETIDSYYADGTINWTYAGRADGNSKADGSGDAVAPTANQFWKDFGIYLKNGNGGYGWWYAIQLKAPGTGTYDVTVNATYPPENGDTKHCIWTETYLFDAALLSDGSGISQQLTEANKMGDFAPVVGDHDVQIGEFDFTAGKEYVLVFRQTQPLYVAGNDGGRTLHLSLAGVTATAQVGEQPQQVGYDFDLLTNYPSVITSTAAFSVEDHKSDIDGLYNAGNINWTYEGRADGNSKTDGSGSAVAPTANKFWKDFGIYLKNGNGGNGWWYAIRIKAPGTGTYNVTVNATYPPENGDTKHCTWTETYLFDASGLSSSVGIADLLTEENKMGDFTPVVGDHDVQIGEFDFVGDREYILVLKQTQPLYVAGNDGGRTLHLSLAGLTMDYVDKSSQETTVPEQTTAPEETTAPDQTTAPEEIRLPGNATGYSFDVRGNYSGYFGSTDFAVEEQTALLDAFYAAGLIDWNFEAKQNGTVKADGTGGEANSFTKNTFVPGGLQANVPYGYNWYYALRVRAPGSGTYDVTVNTNTIVSGGVDKHSVWTESYVLDAAAVDAGAKISDLLTDANKGKMFAPTTENTDAYIGNFAFEAGKEYIIVLRMTKDSLVAAPSQTRTSNLYLAGLSFTEAEPPALPKHGYDFDMVSNYPDDFAAGNWAVEESLDKLNAYYAAGAVDWTFAGKQSGTDINGAAIECFNRNGYTKGDGIQVYTQGYNWWYALRVRAPGSGTYDVTVNTNTVVSGGVDKHSVWTESYVLDAATVDAGAKISDLLTSANKGKMFAPTVDKTDAYIGNFAFEAGKEYIVVLRMTKDSLVAAPSQTRTSNLYLAGLSFTAAEPPAPVNGGYDFDLITVYPDDFTGGTMSVPEQADKIEKLFNGGYLGWKLEGCGAVSGASGEIGRNAFLKGNGIQVYTAGYDWWYALRIHAPGSGIHKITLDTYLADAKDANGNPVKKHSIWTDVYLIEASELDSGKTTIADAMLKRNLLGQFAPTTENPSADIGYYSFEAGKDYVLILRQTKKSLNAGKNADDLSTLNLYLDQLRFTYSPDYVAPAPDNSKVVYDFDLADRENGIYSNNTELADKSSDISRLYSLGEINWKNVDGVGAVAGKFTSGNGLLSYSDPDAYMVFKIQSPGKGLYTVTMNHAVSGRGGTASVYILPADTTDIQKAIDTDNRVGKVKMYNTTGDMTPVDGSTSLVGTWEFGSEKEYIVVLEAFAASPYCAQSYLYLSQLTMEKGDKTANYSTTKTISPVVVDANAVTVTEATLYQATGVVNGHDYFYLPLEGKKMAVYDIDQMAFVTHVDTPFTTCRGITVDEDGIVWMVGDNSYIFRYDPFLDVAQSVYYYKNQVNDGDRSKIYGSSSAFDLTLGSDGCLYFGVYDNAHIAKYDIQTGKFTDLGAYGDDSGAYASCPVYEDGYVYCTLTGDKNGDGVKTFEIVKVDANTGKQIAIVDVTERVSQKEVMLRGMGICGGVLLIGGETNDIKNALAIDAETMEVLDLGITGFINYGTTEEKDGKVYFVASGKGIYAFDGATRTATPVAGLKDAGVGMRCNEDSFVTIENNPLFPGESVFSYRSSLQLPVIYNMQTGKMLTLDGLVLEEYGSAQTIRTMLKGAGENEIYMGAYNTNNCSVYNTVEGKVTHRYEASSAQTDCMYIYEGNLYAGNYNAGCLTQINLQDEERNVVLVSLKDQYEQSRIHAISGGGGKVFFGSVPDMYKYGGCLGWVDVKTLERVIIRNAVQDQSIVSLCYNDGLIFAGSCTTGGTGSVDRTDLSAMIAVYDVATQEKLAEIDLRQYISGMPARLKSIDAILADPNVAENGILWVQCGARLIKLTFDKDTGKASVKQELCYDASSVGDGWLPTGMQILDGYLYAAFGTAGGVRKINLTDLSDNVRIPVADPYFFTVADDGNLYYSINTAHLWMYPLSIEDSDWSAADAIDRQILAIGKVTVESADQIQKIRAAYEALTWTQKALVQHLDKLEEAEIDLIEAWIDSIGEVTLEDQQLIDQIAKAYKQLSTKNRNFVKNYMDVYVPAAQALNELLDVIEAEKVQKMIDSIADMGEITLEDEEAIKAIRAAYDALTMEQRALVDATLLLEAEAKIKALRLEKVEYLKQLIASIGEVTLEDEPVIVEAMEIFDWLTLDERELVDYLTLNSAEKTLRKLQKEAAGQVDALIGKIGTVSIFSGANIRAARTAYDALTEGSKEYVELLDVLLAAEEAYASVGRISIIVAAVVAVAAAGGVVLIVVMKKQKRSTQKIEK